jgi:hypothetical protein
MAMKINLMDALTRSMALVPCDCCGERRPVSRCVAYGIETYACAECRGGLEQCPQCAAFFARFRCSAAMDGECDCPRCQGYCTCNERETR